MAISAKDVMALRQQTGLGLMECKAALSETDGDVAKAIEELRKKGLAKMNTRSDRESSEGRVGVAVSADGTQGVIVEIYTETDFTANNEKFLAMVQLVANEGLKQAPGELQKTQTMQDAIDEVRLTTKENAQFGRGRVFGGEGKKVGAYLHFTGKVGAMVEAQGDVAVELLRDLAMHVSAISPTPAGVRDEDVPAEIVAQEREMAERQAAESGKPAQIIEKMVEGKMRKFFEDNTLLKQLFIKDDKKRVQDLLPKGTTLTGFARHQVGG